MEQKALLNVGDVSVSFGGIQALANVSLSTRKGEIVGLVGPNGAGKTVLLNCINGVYPPERGTIVFMDRPLNGLAPHKIARMGIARTFQQIELFPQMSVLENTMVGMFIMTKHSLLSSGIFWGPGRKNEIKVRRESEEILDFLELYPYRKQLVGNLSYGIQKLVGLARAMAMDPKILLLDEIASGLNREEKEDLARFLLRIKYQWKTSMIWVEHDMKMITQIADKLVCLDYGRKIAEGRPKEVVSDPRVIEAYLGN